MSQSIQSSKSQRNFIKQNVKMIKEHKWQPTGKQQVAYQSMTEEEKKQIIDNKELKATHSPSGAHMTDRFYEYAANVAEKTKKQKEEIEQ